MQRSASASPSTLPLGAVAVASNTPALNVTVPDHNALDAHEHAAERLVNMLSSAQAQPAASHMTASVNAQHAREQSQPDGQMVADAQPSSLPSDEAGQSQDSKLPGVRLKRPSQANTRQPSRLSAVSLEGDETKELLQTSDAAGPVSKKQKVAD